MNMLLFLASMLFAELIIILILVFVIKRRAKKNPGKNQHITAQDVGKMLFTFIMIFVFWYLIYLNFFGSYNYTNFYDIGSGGEGYLTPSARVSASSEIAGVTYRNMTGHLVYFSVPVPENSDSITVTVRFKDNFPIGEKFEVGASDSSNQWHYVYSDLYIKTTNPINLDGGWVERQATFNISAQNLAVGGNGKLSLLLYAKHLGPESETKEMFIPIDWIKIVVHRDGVL